MKIDETNSMVSIEYNLIDSVTNDLLDSNIGKEPLTFITGEKQIINGLELALIGKEAGFSGDVNILAKDAYGERNDDATEDVARENFADIELKDGMTLYGQGENGETVQVVVKSFDEKIVNVDFNHPLAGKYLQFSLKVLNVKPITSEELEEMSKKQNEGGCGSGCGCHS